MLGEKKKNNLKRLYTVCFHLYNILEITKYRYAEQINRCQGLRVSEREGGCGYRAIKGGTRKLWGTVLYLDCSGGYTKPHVTKWHRNKNIKRKIVLYIYLLWIHLCVVKIHREYSEKILEEWAGNWEGRGVRGDFAITFSFLSLKRTCICYYWSNWKLKQKMLEVSIHLLAYLSVMS